MQKVLEIACRMDVTKVIFNFLLLYPHNHKKNHFKQLVSVLEKENQMILPCSHIDALPVCTYLLNNPPASLFTVVYFSLLLSFNSERRARVRSAKEK